MSFLKSIWIHGASTTNVVVYVPPPLTMLETLTWPLVQVSDIH